MAKVIEIGISEKLKGKMQSVNTVRAIAGKGIINDRYFKEKNHEKSQITLIEIENISHYNKIFKTNIFPINFRRNIITEGIKLNELVGKKFLIGNVQVKAHDLCRPCKTLQETLKQQKNFVKELLFKGGLRCEILHDGEITIGDKIIF